VKTAAPFVPHGTDAPGRLIEGFDRLQAEQIACVREADGLPLGRVTITSPFDARIKYNLFSCLTILPATSTGISGRPNRCGGRCPNTDASDT
jgi:hypothetical protein